MFERLIQPDRGPVFPECISEFRWPRLRRIDGVRRGKPQGGMKPCTPATDSIHQTTVDLRVVRIIEPRIRSISDCTVVPAGLWRRGVLSHTATTYRHAHTHDGLLESAGGRVLHPASGVAP